MNISELLKQEQGRTIYCCNTPTTVKKPKSKLQTGDEWTQECVLSDLSGDVAAEVLLDGISLGRGEQITITSCQPQTGSDGTRLYVISYRQETQTEPDMPQPHFTEAEIEQNKSPNWDRIARGKTKCNIICAMIVNGQINLEYNPVHNRELLSDSKKKNIEKLIEYIFE